MGDVFLSKNASSFEPVTNDNCDLCLQLAGIFTKIAISEQTCSVAIPLVCAMLGDRAEECKQVATPVCEKVVQALADGDAPEKIPPMVCKALQLCDADGLLMELFAHHAADNVDMLAMVSSSPGDPNDAKCDGCLAIAGLIAKVAISDTTCQVIGVVCGLLQMNASKLLFPSARELSNCWRMAMRQTRFLLLSAKVCDCASEKAEVALGNMLIDVPRGHVFEPPMGIWNSCSLGVTLWANCRVGI